MNGDFPKWVYFADGSSALIEGPAELAELPGGWAESPAAFEARPEPKRRGKQ